VTESWDLAVFVFIMYCACVCVWVCVCVVWGWHIGSNPKICGQKISARYVHQIWFLRSQFMFGGPHPINPLSEANLSPISGQNLWVKSLGKISGQKSLATQEPISGANLWCGPHKSNLRSQFRGVPP